MRPINFLILLILSLSNSVFASSAHVDPVVDPKAPPAINELIIPSGDDRMAGLIYMANGPGPHPTVVLLHGFPGNEKNLDLAQAIRRSGFNVVFFHYRGSWGSEGTFSLLQIDDDAMATLNFLRKPEVAQRFRVDVNKLSLLGHSMGGFGALSAGHLEKDLVCVGAMSPANFAVYAGAINAKDPGIEGFKNYIGGLFMLSGFTGDAMTKQLTSVPIDSLDTSKFGPGLHGKSVFMVIGDQDNVTPAEAMFDPVVKAYSEDKDINFQHLKISGDHSFSWSRIKLTDVVVAWLESDCR
jgi:pimeloyl-ACP methyl ester carboxylesterase